MKKIPPQNNCETLTQLKEDTKVKSAIDNLKTRTIVNKEYAYSIERSYSTATQTYTFKTELKTGDNFNTNVPVGGNHKGQTHNHPINGQSIPSFGDVKWLRACKENIFPRTSIAYNIIICPNPNSPNDTSTAIIYAITIDSDNFSALDTKINEMWNREDLIGKNDYEKLNIINKEYSKKFASVQNNSSGMEKKFIDLYQDFGINLMKFNPNTQNWEKLVIENNVVTPKPCE